MVLESVVQYLSELGQNILTAARNFTFKDAIDVAIVTVLLYSAIKLVRETRAGQLVKGIILLIVLFLISYQLDLLMLNAILRAFLSSGIVIVVILFQPEIRKALEQVGTARWSSPWQTPFLPKIRKRAKRRPARPSRAWWTPPKSSSSCAWAR
ncbi:MAG: hypothetical protein ACLU5C_10955 [Acutalibacter sp.]